MAVAVSLLPEILRPANDAFVTDESHTGKYDHNKHYVKVYDDGALVWYSGASLNYMDQWEHESRKRMYQKWMMNETE